jgi:PHB/PHA accumulation regulator DNA-binding domain.
MQTIKKYANRKLYHIDRKQYITLEALLHWFQQANRYG